MNVSKTTLTLVMTVALGAAGSVSAAQSHNPFSMQQLDSGYVQLAEKSMDGKCGANKEAKASDGSCGANKVTKTKAKDGKCGEGKCGANKTKEDEKVKQASCGDNKG